MAEDIDLPPASDDEDVQGFLDTRWREAMRASRELMENLRAIHPDLMEHLPETAERRIAGALTSAQSAYRDLHAAGKHVIGQERYDEYLAAQTRRRVDG